MGWGELQRAGHSRPVLFQRFGAGSRQPDSNARWDRRPSDRRARRCLSQEPRHAFEECDERCGGLRRGFEANASTSSPLDAYRCEEGGHVRRLDGGWPRLVGVRGGDGRDRCHSHPIGLGALARVRCPIVASVLDPCAAEIGDVGHELLDVEQERRPAAFRTAPRLSSRRTGRRRAPLSSRPAPRSAPRCLARSPGCRRRWAAADPAGRSGRCAVRARPGSRVAPG